MHTDGTASQARNYTKNYVLLVEPHFADRCPILEEGTFLKQQ
jgi:hypothetical protein